ncbi:TerB family tellurite resistance protein [Marinigracilibium pacificum]|uniref:TerB family tellurite resistance protein n=1 Tax=Marinigracilibium pacificum TaxID=2729599 RepID=A0A848J1X4_9BACT|nr:TerB family tellurite resistance protein [Marinigracilibium pacificum]NMM49721.1 TerB family tellurite resistance protein [Marinigracilibium pacificum]
MILSNEKQLRILIEIAKSDGELHPDELSLIMRIAEGSGIDQNKVKEFIVNPKPSGKLEALTFDQKFEYLYNIILLMKADKRITFKEIKHCQNIAKKLGFNPSVVSELSAHIYSDPSIAADINMLQNKAKKYLINL